MPEEIQCQLSHRASVAVQGAVMVSAPAGDPELPEGPRKGDTSGRATIPWPWRCRGGVGGIMADLHGAVKVSPALSRTGSRRRPHSALARWPPVCYALAWTRPLWHRGPVVHCVP
jgi:hypothetical protein